ncbi:MAG: LysR family transcriptional regulator [Pseudomonadota bacterium]
MNWNDLPIALAIARDGSLSAAAARLGKNHSTVFRRLNALEESLGVRLFDRQASGYVPTSVGRMLLANAERAADAVDDLARQAQGQDRRPAGDVRLTTNANLAADHVAPILAKLSRSHPDLRVEVIVSDSEYDLSRREADLALRDTRSPPEHLIGRKVIDYQWYLVASANYLADHGQAPIDLAHLSEHRFVGPAPALAGLAALHWLMANIRREQIIASASNFSTMAALAAQGMGIAVLPSDLVAPDLQRVMRLPLPPAESGALWLLNHPDLREVARVRAVADALLVDLRAHPTFADGLSPPPTVN